MQRVITRNLALAARFQSFSRGGGVVSINPGASSSSLILSTFTSDGSVAAAGFRFSSSANTGAAFANRSTADQAKAEDEQKARNPKGYPEALLKKLEKLSPEQRAKEEKRVDAFYRAINVTAVMMIIFVSLLAMTGAFSEMTPEQKNEAEKIWKDLDEKVKAAEARAKIEDEERAKKKKEEATA